MHGPTRRCGSVASLCNIKNPSKVAKLVMEQTDHIMLVGAGALEFAKAWGFKEENLLTEKSRFVWLVWKQSLRDKDGHNNWTDGLGAPKETGTAPAALLRQFPNVDPETLAWAQEVASYPVTGAINCLALSRKDEMSGCTTTSGLSWKIPGRIGDSPTIGAGVYVDQEIGAAGSHRSRRREHTSLRRTHHRRKYAPRYVAEGCLPWMCSSASRGIMTTTGHASTSSTLTSMCCGKSGQFAGASLWNGAVRGGQLRPRQFAIADGGKVRLENCIYLFERK